jgi:predicted DsbA family dithiol-disulfide isomerase
MTAVEDSAARLVALLERVPQEPVRFADDGRSLLSPPLLTTRDRFDGPVTARATLLVFAAHATPASRTLSAVLERARERHLVAWRHYPDPAAHPRAVTFALAAEAAALSGKFWALTRELLRLRHDEAEDLHAAMLRAGLDPERALDAMRAGAGSDRIVEDVSSARASGVEYVPALFVNGEQYRGPLEADAVVAALDASASLPRD